MVEIKLNSSATSQKFLMLEELGDTSSSVVLSADKPDLKDCKITAFHLTAIWDKVSAG